MGWQQIAEGLQRLRLLDSATLMQHHGEYTMLQHHVVGGVSRWALVHRLLLTIDPSLESLLGSPQIDMHADNNATINRRIQRIYDATCS
jgi:hypothetical protein